MELQQNLQRQLSQILITNRTMKKFNIQLTCKQVVILKVVVDKQLAQIKSLSIDEMMNHDESGELELDEVMQATAFTVDKLTVLSRNLKNAMESLDNQADEMGIPVFGIKAEIQGVDKGTLNMALTIAEGFHELTEGKDDEVSRELLRVIQKIKTTLQS